MFATIAFEFGASGTCLGNLVFHGPDRAKPLVGPCRWESGAADDTGVPPASDRIKTVSTDTLLTFRRMVGTLGRRTSSCPPSPTLVFPHHHPGSPREDAAQLASAGDVQFAEHVGQVEL